MLSCGYRFNPAHRCATTSALRCSSAAPAPQYPIARLYPRACVVLHYTYRHAVLPNCTRVCLPAGMNAASTGLIRASVFRMTLDVWSQQEPPPQGGDGHRAVGCCGSGGRAVVGGLWWGGCGGGRSLGRGRLILGGIGCPHVEPEPLFQGSGGHWAVRLCGSCDGAGTMPRMDRAHSFGRAPHRKSESPVCLLTPAKRHLSIPALTSAQYAAPPRSPKTCCARLRVPTP